MRLVGTVLIASALLIEGCSLFHPHEDVKSGYVGPAALTQDQVVRLLNQQRYTDISGLHKNDSDWVGGAQKDGRQLNFDIEPDGTIRTK